MNLAYRDIRHNLRRFLLTCVGLGLLLGVVLAMIGIYAGLVVDALTIARPPAVDLWVVESNSRGPFAEASRVPGDTREAIARMADVAAAGSITYQTVEAEHGGSKLRLYVIGHEPTRPGGPPEVFEGRDIARNHYEMVADRTSGLVVGDTIQLGRNVFTVVGLTRFQVNSGGDPAVYITLPDAQKLQFDLAPPAARAARAWRRRREPRHRQCGRRPAASERLPRRRRRNRAALAAPLRHHPGGPGGNSHQLACRPGPAADRAVHVAAAGRLRGDHRPHHLHDDHGEAEEDRHAEADRRA
jgi:hypothetical protein